MGTNSNQVIAGAHAAVTAASMLQAEPDPSREMVMSIGLFFYAAVRSKLRKIGPKVIYLGNGATPLHMSAPSKA